MRPLYPIALSLLLSANCSAQILGILGSSTAAGGGATTFDSSWVGRTALFYKNLGQLSRYYDLAFSGSTTWNGMPTSFVFPSGVTIAATDTPDRADNVTNILRLGSDVVVVAYPTNDLYNGYTMTEFMSNLHVIYDSVVAVGKICWVTTTQPRDDANPTQRQLLLAGKDSIMAEFPGRALDFWTPVTDPSTLGILSQYSAGDAIHLNNAGHAVIARVAENANIMDPSPLALTLTGFNARWTGQDVLLQWTATNDDPHDPILFDVQRSTNGSSFTSLYKTTTAGSGSWSYTDNDCPAGTSFYRLSWLDGAKTSYSKTIPIDRSTHRLTIDNLYLSGGSALISEIELPDPGDASIVILSLSGRLILKKAYSGLSSSATLSIPLPALANGEYVLKIITPDGQATAKPFVKF
jgi:lysophospholipase L1-like esterase